MTTRLEEMELALEAIHNRYPEADVIMIAGVGGAQATCRTYGKPQRLRALMEAGMATIGGTLAEADKHQDGKGRAH